mmetsp:Transcript_91378/g.261576  ORF Transcript_91378/g.261576 Transcript_91378/m.261576 type:complete len:216 (-) Transcript_91378:492-1139(-)
MPPWLRLFSALASPVASWWPCRRCCPCFWLQEFRAPCWSSSCSLFTSAITTSHRLRLSRSRTSLSPTSTCPSRRRLYVNWVRACPRLFATFPTGAAPKSRYPSAQDWWCPRASAWCAVCLTNSFERGRSWCTTCPARRTRAASPSWSSASPRRWTEWRPGSSSSKCPTSRAGSARRTAGSPPRTCTRLGEALRRRPSPCTRPRASSAATSSRPWT